MFYSEAGSMIPKRTQGLIMMDEKHWTWKIIGTHSILHKEAWIEKYKLVSTGFEKMIRWRNSHLDSS